MSNSSPSDRYKVMWEGWNKVIVDTETKQPLIESVNTETVKLLPVICNMLNRIYELEQQVKS